MGLPCGWLGHLLLSSTSQEQLDLKRVAPTGTVPSPLIADLREHLAMSSLVSPGHMLFSQAYKDLLLSFVSEGSFGFTNASSSSHSVGCTLLSSIGGLTHLETLN